MAHCPEQQHFPESGGALQPLWSAITWYGQPVVSHWLFAGWLTLVAYLLVCFYFTWKDLCRHESKIQKDWWPTPWDMWEAAWPQLVAYIGLNGLFTVLFPTFVELPAIAPSVLRFCAEVTACFVVGDFLIYWMHVGMHVVPFFRNHIHSVHHQYHICFSWAGGWVHPLEDAFAVACQVPFPLLYGVHPLSFWVFTFIWTVLLIEEHSGHDVWWAPSSWMPLAAGRPLGGGAAVHDIHHYRPNKNFGFVLVVWDVLFGTFTPTVTPLNRPKSADRWWEWQRHLPEAIPSLLPGGDRVVVGQKAV